ncbi:MAG: hypothetical protein A2Y33_12740 [Spirochaetes bacterium GWF1_51_8]|nr:MAG: hypothetical protein A2Y33_12740 [Spirochaetes bacterium GWF1_51_8]
MRPTARLCYDHLSGILGEAIHTALFRNGFLIGGDKPELSPAGEEELRRLGMDLDALKQPGRKPIAPCVERAEGKMYPHMGAHLGAILLDGFLKIGWLTPAGEGGKDFSITGTGRDGFDKLGVYLPSEK